MKNQINISQDRFKKIFPFYFTLNEDLIIESCGDSIKKLQENIICKSFGEVFSFIRPHLEKISFEELANLKDTLVIIELITNNKVRLRGQFEILTDERNIFFIGSPWFDNLETIIQNNLTLNDFANHDSLIDLLHIIKANEIATEDLKTLLQTHTLPRRSTLPRPPSQVLSATRLRRRFVFCLINCFCPPQNDVFFACGWMTPITNTKIDFYSSRLVRES